jgi:hypothetical protein
VYTPLVGGQCAPQYWPMKPSNAHSPRPMNGPRTAASQPVPARGPAGVGGTRHGGRGARGPRHGKQAEAGKRPACSRPLALVPASHWNPPNPPFLSKARAPRLGSAYVSAASPPVAHVPRPVLPRAPPSARVRLADPPFLSRASLLSGPQRRAPSSSPPPE